MSTVSVPSLTGKWPTQPLSSVVDRIFVGIPTSRHAAKTGDKSITVPVLSVSDIDDGYVSSVDSIPRVELRLDGFDRFRVQPGDVLVSCRGTQLKVALVFHHTSGAYASSSIITVRPNPSMILPQLILALLQSSAWEAILRSRTRSSTGLMQLTVKDLEDLAVPVPPFEIQVKLAELVDADERAYRRAIQAADARRMLVKSLVSHVLLDHAMETTR